MVFPKLPFIDPAVVSDSPFFVWGKLDFDLGWYFVTIGETDLVLR